MSAQNDNAKYTWSVSDSENTGIPIIGLFNTETKVLVSTPIPNPGIEVRTLTGVVGANFSRLVLSTVELFERAMKLKRNPAEVLGKIINPKDYGHSSVAELVRTELYFENLPDWLVTAVLNMISLGAAQQRSTRYIKGFSNSESISILDKIDPINSQKYSQELKTFDRLYKDLQELAYNNCKKWNQILEPRMAKAFDIEESNTKEVETNKIRTLDRSQFLPQRVGTLW